MGNESIEISLKNIWQSWLIFRQGKNFTEELHAFQYHIERNLYALFQDLNNGKYQHGGYNKFVVCDNKRREISVASIRDRVVHRLLYDYLTKIYDKTFIYDAWSCRVGKGLLGAINRTQQFLHSFPDAFIWRADVQKFFDSVDHQVLIQILRRKIKDPKTVHLLEGVIHSFSKREGESVGMPIGNLTSQIFANIYLNELDRFVKHTLKPCAYLRYGDDFLLFNLNKQELMQFRARVIHFLAESLKLKLQPKNDIIVKAQSGLKFLGVILYPNSRKLNARNQNRIQKRLNLKNVGSYYGLVKVHGSPKVMRKFGWDIIEKLV